MSLFSIDSTIRNCFFIKQKPLVFKRGFTVDKVTQKISQLKVKAPTTVDFNVNGACNLNCTWCWGPDHKAKEELTNEQWKTIAAKLRDLGTCKITFTGGETLMKEGLDSILEYTKKDLGIRTTLSTNGILLKRCEAKVLPYVDDIGLPLDGHSRDVNHLMRFGPPKHFDRVLGAIKLIQDKYPKIDLTVRTVLSAKNKDSVPLIGQTMLDHGINPEKLRWKIYQIAPIGIRKEDVVNGDWLISSEEFEEVVAKIVLLNKNFPSIDTLGLNRHVGRYFQIYPDGKSHIFQQGKDGFPYQNSLGNIGKDFDQVMENLMFYDLVENKVR